MGEARRPPPRRRDFTDTAAPGALSRGARAGIQPPFSFDPWDIVADRVRPPLNPISVRPARTGRCDLAAPAAGAIRRSAARALLLPTVHHRSIGPKQLTEVDFQPGTWTVVCRVAELYRLTPPLPIHARRVVALRESEPFQVEDMPSRSPCAYVSSPFDTRS